MSCAKALDTVLFDHAWKLVQAIRGGGTPPFLTPDEAANNAVPYLLERLAERNSAVTAVECDTCNGHGMVGGFVSADSGYQSDACQACCGREQ